MGNGLSARLLRGGIANLARIVPLDSLPFMGHGLPPLSLTLPLPPSQKDFSTPSDVVMTPSVASRIRTFANATKTKFTSPFQAREVIRTSDGRVVGPSSQYILSAINNNKNPFGLGTFVRVLTYFTLLYGVMKTGTLNSPADLVSVVDDVGDTIVHLGVTAFQGTPELRTDYFKGFFTSVYTCDSASPFEIPTVTCYPPGGMYYQHAIQNPDHARLWGYLGGLTPQQKELMFSLFLAAGSGAFIYANRRSLQTMVQDFTSKEPRLGNEDVQALGRSAAKIGAATVGAMAFCLGASREVAHPVATVVMLGAAVATIAHEYRGPIQQVIGAKDIPWGRAIFYGLLWAGGEAIYRSLADSAGMYQFTPTGHETIYGNWTKWDWVMNFPLLVTDLTTELMVMGPWWARASGVVQNTAEVGVALLSRKLHKNSEMAGPIQRWFQGALPALISQKDPVTGLELPSHLSVRSQIQGFTQAEKDAVKEGRMPEGMLSAGAGYLLTGGAVLFLGVNGVDSLAALMAGQSHQVVADAVLTLLGFGATGILADAALRDGKGRQIFTHLASFLGHQFGPRGRGPYWVIYTLIGTSMTATLGVTSQAIKGFKIDEAYLNRIFERALVNPWVNRLQLGLLTAYFPDKAVSKFRFFALGFFTVYCGIDFSAQTTQSLDLHYHSDARDFTLTTDPDRKAELLGRLAARESLVRDAIAHDGFGRPEMLAIAHKELTSILSTKDQYGIPKL